MTPAIPEPKPSAEALTVPALLQAIDFLLTGPMRIVGDDIKRRARELSASAPANAPAGEVVVTTNKAGQCVCVSRQDEDGRILSVIWEAPANADAAMGDAVRKLPAKWRAMRAHTYASENASEYRAFDRGLNYAANELEAALSADKASGEVGR